MRFPRAICFLFMSLALAAAVCPRSRAQAALLAAFPCRSSRRRFRSRRTWSAWPQQPVLTGAHTPRAAKLKSPLRGNGGKVKKDRRVA